MQIQQVSDIPTCSAARLTGNFLSITSATASARNASSYRRPRLSFPIVSSNPNMRSEIDLLSTNRGEDLNGTHDTQFSFVRPMLLSVEAPLRYQSCGKACHIRGWVAHGHHITQCRNPRGTMPIVLYRSLNSLGQLLIISTGPTSTVKFQVLVLVRGHSSYLCTDHTVEARELFFEL